MARPYGLNKPRPGNGVATAPTAATPPSARLAPGATGVSPQAMPDVEDSIPMGIRTAAGWAWRVFLIAGLIAGVGWLFGYLSEVTIPLAVAVLLCALLSPVTNRLKRWGVPSALAVLITVIGGFALVAGALTLIVTEIVSGSDSLVTQATKGFTQLTTWLQTGPLHLNANLFRTGALTAKVTQFLKESQSTLTTYAADVGSRVGHFFAGFAITIFALFYFLAGGRTIWTFLLKFFPRGARARVDHATGRGWTALGHYVRATIAVALVDGLGVLIVALILGVPLAPALAALVFLGAFVPIVGAFVSGFLAVLVALVALGWIKALIMLAGIVVVMEIEAHLLQPFLLGRAVKLHPLAVLIGIAIGVVVAGIVGALFSIPLLAFLKTFIQQLTDRSDPLPEANAAPVKT